MTIIQEVWHFAVSQDKQFMDCVIASNKGEHLFTNTCFLKLQMEFLNMNFDEKDNCVTVIMKDYSVDEIIKLFNGYVITDVIDSESGRNQVSENTIRNENNDMEPELVELKERRSNATVQGKRGTKKSSLCHVCGKEFLTSIKLAVHKFQVHSMNEESYKCSICFKVMKTKSILYKHMFIHSDPRFSCIICSRVWIVKSLYKSHLNLIILLKPKLPSRWNFKKCAFCSPDIQTKI